MRRVVYLSISSIACLILIAFPVSAQLRAFPGAEGWGATSLGARGGNGYELRFVTHHSWSGPGSIGRALTAPTNGKGVFVIFRISGYIDIPNGVNPTIDQPFMYIAGQTAPGGGVCLRLDPSSTGGDFLLAIKASHVIVRYLGLRHGADPSGGDQSTNIIVRTGSSDVMVDHCVSQWGSDEAADIDADPDDVRNVTFQRCAFIEGLEYHSTGFRVGGNADKGGFSGIPYHISIHHNFFAHNNSRNPRVGSKPPDGIGVEIVNNALYGTTESGGVDFNSVVDIVGNYIKETSGFPDLQWETNLGFNGRPWFANRQDSTQFPPVKDPSIHMHGNVTEYVSGNTRTDGVNYDLIRDETTLGQPIPSDWRRAQPMPQPPFPITEVSAQQAWTDIVVNGEVGNIHFIDERGVLQRRTTDPALDRVIVDAANGEPQRQSNQTAYIHHPNDVGGYPAIASGTPYKDSDNDGMGDQWEIDNGLDPNDASDFSGDHDGDGYLNIEEFLNGDNPGDVPTAPTNLQVIGG